MANPRLCGGTHKSLTFPGNLGRGPGARAWCAKSIGRAGPHPGGSDRLPQDEAGRSGDRPGGPTREGKLYGDARTVGPPVPWNQSRLMIFGHHALAPGPGTGAQAAFRGAPGSIRFERFTYFPATGSGGGYGRRKGSRNPRRGTESTPLL